MDFASFIFFLFCRVSHAVLSSDVCFVHLQRPAFNEFQYKGCFGRTRSLLKVSYQRKKIQYAINQISFTKDIQNREVSVHVALNAFVRKAE